MNLLPRPLLYFRRVEQRSNDCRGANADCNTGFHKLAAAFLVGAVGVVVVSVRHSRISMAIRAAWEAA